MGIFGSRYLDRNSKLDVFKLPRTQVGSEKRKLNGPIVESLPPRKKRKVVKKRENAKRSGEEKQEAFERRELEDSRLSGVHVVDNEWPMEEIKDLDPNRKSRDNLRQNVEKKRRRVSNQN